MKARSFITKSISGGSVSVFSSDKISSEIFGEYVFNMHQMQKMLPPEVYQKVLLAHEGKGKIAPEIADTIALALKDWAMELGATHYCHWFQPLTGRSAEKHDAFLDWVSSGAMLEKFTGKQLVQGEPDASSFPSGGLRSTYEARGYTGWDPSSFPFVWKGGDGITLCIPSVFFSWTGDVLDDRIPLLRADGRLNDAVLRLLKLAGMSADRVFSTLGLEQEYFVVDRRFRNLRPDLVLLGKTVYGAMPSKGQELQDHYFGTVKDRVLSFMRDFEIEALRLGIPVKTRHNEVAPAQFEVAPIFERAVLAVDHNLLLMELMHQAAEKHGLACLLHEKPFKGFNGSGKHCNWSLSTEDGVNLLDPTGGNWYFIVLLVAILDAVYENAGVLRAAIGSYSNDDRLGAHEAPPAIISVYLGQQLERFLESIENSQSREASHEKEKYDLGLPVLPELIKDYTDRNRTSPFAFTGNKFEFRSLGSSANPAFTATVLNAAVAKSLENILDDIEKQLPRHEVVSEEQLFERSLPILRQHIKASKAIRFSGDNYSAEWIDEAKKRGLPHYPRSDEAFSALLSARTRSIFQNILTEHELKSRKDILTTSYRHFLAIEIDLMVDLFNTEVLPASLETQKNLAKACLKTEGLLGVSLNEQKKRLVILSQAIEEAIWLAVELEGVRVHSMYFLGTNEDPEGILMLKHRLRKLVDQIEGLVEDRLWTLPKYRELLFLI